VHWSHVADVLTTRTPNQVAATLIRDVGFEPADAGPLRIARYLEPLALLVAQLADESEADPELAYRFEWFRKEPQGARRPGRLWLRGRSLSRFVRTSDTHGGHMRKPIVVLAIALCSARAAAAQGYPNTRQGFWIGFGLGAGSVGADCQSCTNDRTAGPSGYVRLGGAVSQHVLLGGETNGWVHTERGLDESMGFLSGVLYWYPSRTGALYLKFGLGGMSYRADDGTDVITATAGAGCIGVGYEFRVRPNMSLALFLTSLASAPVTFRVNGQLAPSSEDFRMNLVQVGLGLTWH
jgi:hypothetical protein